MATTRSIDECILLACMSRQHIAFVELIEKVEKYIGTSGLRGAGVRREDMHSSIVDLVREHNIIIKIATIGGRPSTIYSITPEGILLLKYLSIQK